MKLTQKLVDTFNSYSDICRHLGYPLNGTGTRKAKADCESFNTGHFGKRPWQTKYLEVPKQCPVCDKPFTVSKGHPREKTTCSYSCSNTYFRSGENNPNWKEGSDHRYYRKIAFNNLPICCNKCDFDSVPEVLHVHHKDRDRTNHKLSNLEILCPTCHEVNHFLAGDGKWS